LEQQRQGRERQRQQITSFRRDRTPDRSSGHVAGDGMPVIFKTPAPTSGVTMSPEMNFQAQLAHHAHQASMNHIMSQIISKMKEDTSAPSLLMTTPPIMPPNSFGVQNFIPQTTPAPSKSIKDLRKLFNDMHTNQNTNVNQRAYYPSTQSPLAFNEPIWSPNNILPFVLWS